MNLATETAPSFASGRKWFESYAPTDIGFWKSIQPPAKEPDTIWAEDPEGKPGGNYRTVLILDNLGNLVDEILVQETSGSAVPGQLYEAPLQRNQIYILPVSGETASRKDTWLDSLARQKEQEQREGIAAQIRVVFEAAREEMFEDGMESEFSRSLVSLIRKYGNAALNAVSNLITSERANAEVASEALRWLGHMDHPQTYRYRLSVLERSLRCSSPRVRDGAALGLASLDDPDAIPYLEQAIEQEHFAELRDDMKEVLVQLEKTRQCRFS